MVNPYVNFFFNPLNIEFKLEYKEINPWYVIKMRKLIL